MPTSILSLQHGLEDMLSDLQFARRRGDLGRLALLAYCEVRRWAREANDDDLAKRSSALVGDFPYPSRDEFLAAVDELIDQVEHVYCSVVTAPLGSQGAKTPNSMLFNESKEAINSALV